MNYRKLIPLLLALTLLSGCRTRLIDDPTLADTVVYEQAAPDPVEEPPDEPTDTAEDTEPPEESETVEQPEEALPPADTAESDPSAEAAQPTVADTLQETGVAALTETTAWDITVTYDPNGGESAVAYTVVHTGERYGAQPDATRRGFAFDGWWSAPDGGEQISPDTVVTLTEDHTLYAHWQSKRTCTVTLDGNGGRVKSKDAQLELSDGDCYGTLPTPLREGYEFLGWFTAPDGGDPIGEADVFSGTDDRTLYAQWRYDAFAFWTFTLQNKTQQVYLCQQASIYLETEQSGVTLPRSALISATGSLNIAESRDDSTVTDDWVLAKKPQVVLKCVGSLSDAAAVRQSMAARFPEANIYLVASSALSDPAEALYAELALAAQLYPDWYTDVDLSVVASELGITTLPISF
jgi:uncharacterized repeat protein (TIGR02543 family)